MRRRILQIATYLAIVATVFFVVAWLVSFELTISAHWETGSHRNEIALGRGTVIVGRFTDWPRTQPFRVSLLRRNRKADASFRQSPEWDDNSWWETAGWSVNKRCRFMGFEKASGKYWPPFAWQLPIAPFRLFMLPLWFPTLISAILPLSWIVRGMRRRFGRSHAASIPTNVRCSDQSSERNERPHTSRQLFL